MEIVVSIIFLVLFFLFVGGESSKKWIFKDSPQQKGEKAEQRVISELLRAGIPPENIFYDLYVERSKGFFSQIDVALLTEVGIIVIEVKNYSGWIFGSGNHRQWTQILAYGKEKHRLYNPVMQNHGHILDMRQHIGGQIPFYSLIVFDGDCVLKKVEFIPKGVFVVKMCDLSGVVRAILANRPPIDYHDRDRIVQLLKGYEENGKNPKIKEQHVRNTLSFFREKKLNPNAAPPSNEGGI